MPPTAPAFSPRSAISTSIRPGWRRRRSPPGHILISRRSRLRYATPSRSPAPTAGCADQGPSRSRRQGRARRHADRGLDRRAGQRRARPSDRSRVRDASIASTMPTGRKFGFPFIVCVRRHTSDSILRQFERRLTNDMTAERAAALGEIFRIVGAAPRRSASTIRPAERCMAGFRPTCSILMAAVPPPGSRSN